MIDVGALKGNGTGPEITAATPHVLEATGLALHWSGMSAEGRAHPALTLF